jgi:hypothetical protein
MQLEDGRVSHLMAENLVQKSGTARQKEGGDSNLAVGRSAAAEGDTDAWTHKNRDTGREAGNAPLFAPRSDQSVQEHVGVHGSNLSEPAGDSLP